MIQMKNKIIEFLTNKKILILGFGREGKSAYNFIKENNIKYKSLGIADKNEIDIDNVEKHCGGNYLDSTKDYDLVIKSPGIIIKDYINGVTLTQLGRRYGTTNSTIKRFLILNNVTVTTKNMILRDINKCKEIAEDYKTHNVNMQFTMAKYGICFQTLKTILKRFNVPIKNTNGKLKTV